MKRFIVWVIYEDAFFEVTIMASDEKTAKVKAVQAVFREWALIEVVVVDSF